MKAWWGGAVASGLLLLASYLLLPVGLPRELLYIATCAGAGVALLLGVWLHRPARRAAWAWMALGMVVMTTGESTFAWYEYATGEVPYPSLADAFYLGAYPLLGMGLIQLIRVRSRGLDVPGLIDSAIFTIGLGLLSWVVLVGPILQDTSTDLALRLLGSAYPAADILLLALLIRLVTLPGARTVSYRLLAGAITLMLAGDSLYLVMATLGVAEDTLTTMTWMSGYVLWMMSALHPSMRTLAESGAQRPASFTGRRLAALTVAILLAPGTLAVQLGLGLTETGWPVVTSCVVLFLLVVARMYISFRVVVKGMSERDLLQQNLAHQAAHDPLTGLPNRARVLALIDAAVPAPARMRRRPRCCSSTSTTSRRSTTRSGTGPATRC